MRVRLGGDWGEASRILHSMARGKRLERAVDKAVLQTAHEFRKAVVVGFRTQAPGGQKFKPLSKLTIAMRKAKRGRASRKALIDTGDLRNSIRLEKVPNGVVVGVSKNARTKDGKKLMSIALVHEYGATIRMVVTKKMHGFFFAMLAKAGIRKRRSRGGKRRARVSVVGVSRGGFRVGAVIVIKIPARPFFRPVMKQMFGDRRLARAKFMRRVARILAGDLGGPANLGLGRGRMSFRTGTTRGNSRLLSNTGGSTGNSR